MLFKKLFFAVVIVLLFKILFICIVIYFRNFFILVLNSFIGAVMFVFSFGYLVGNIPNFFSLLDELNKEEDFELVF